MGGKEKKKPCDLPALFDLNLGLSVRTRTRTAVFLVDVKLFLPSKRAVEAVLFGYLDLFFKAAGRRSLG